MRTCTFAGCGRKHYGKNLCRAHYNQQWRGSPLGPISTPGGQTKSLPDRFWPRVNTDAGPSGCWPWKGKVEPNGYCKSSAFGWAHRFAYVIEHGDIPAGLTIDHLCRNTVCVNPAHLEAVTQRENTLRGFSPWAIRARQTHCVRGHEFDQNNTYVSKNGTRHCRACKRTQERQRRQSRAAAA